MDPWSPRSLQDLCINVLAKRIDILWTWKKRPLICETKRLAQWKDPELFLHSHIADKLLERLSYEKTLDDSILSTFTDQVHLQNVRTGFCHNVSEWGLKVLSHHKLTSLQVVTRLPHSHSICTVLRCIGNKSYDSLQNLAISRNCQERLSFPYEIWPDDNEYFEQSLVETLSRFNCLWSLDIRDTNLTNTHLAILGKNLPHVVNLDLSWNCEITDISPLKNCQKTLKSLSLCQLSGIEAESTLATFVTLSGLTFLDMSLQFGIGSRNVFTWSVLLQMPNILPNLVCLDLSCRKVESERALRHFLDAHQSLQSLMLCGSLSCKYKSLQDYKPRLTVGGDATLEQYRAALQHYNRRKNHPPIADYEDPAEQLVQWLYCDLMALNLFPPCLDDQLVQELLDSIPTRPSFLRIERVWYFASKCLKVIAVLLEKGIITHLQPDTKRHLLLLCNRTIQRSIGFHGLSQGYQTAVQVLRSLGGPEPSLLW